MDGKLPGKGHEVHSRRGGKNTERSMSTSHHQTGHDSGLDRGKTAALGAPFSLPQLLFFFHTVYLFIFKNMYAFVYLTIGSFLQPVGSLSHHERSFLEAHGLSFCSTQAPELGGSVGTRNGLTALRLVES